MTITNPDDIFTYSFRERRKIVKMIEVRCFICGGRIGRGMHPSVGAKEPLDQLVSVNQRVQHSTTIICNRSYI